LIEITQEILSLNNGGYIKIKHCAFKRGHFVRHIDVMPLAVTFLVF
jgi:hypothetical protein